MNFAVIDIETTGGSFGIDRITEIGIVKHDGTKVIDHYHTMVDPERPIPYFITKLTGITDAMVENAPKFFEIAKDVVEFTEGCFFVAHNVKFDFGFIHDEFKNLGYDYQRKQLCTVIMSRKLLPGHKSYSLGKLCASLNIGLKNHHRALDDAKATAEILTLLCKEEGFQHYTNPSEKELITSKKNNDPILNKINSFPQSIGIYYLYNSKKEIIYIGKTVNIRKRIFNHLYKAKTKKAIEMKEEVTDFTVEVTHNEMIALLLENDETKKQKPKYNRTAKKLSFPYGFISYENQKGYLKIDLVKNTKAIQPFIAFTNKELALGKLEEIEKEFELCQSINKNEHRIGSCTNRSLKICKGACQDIEQPKDYNQRVIKAIENVTFRNKSFYLQIDSHVIVVSNGKYAGTHRLENQSTTQVLENLDPRNDRDALLILSNHIKKYTSKIVLF